MHEKYDQQKISSQKSARHSSRYKTKALYLIWFSEDYSIFATPYVIYGAALQLWKCNIQDTVTAEKHDGMT
jgi:hypothetical protein